MNRVILMGRLTKDPDIRYSQNDQTMTIARYTLAVDRRGGRRDGGDGQQTADFVDCVAFGKKAEFAEKYLRKGVKIAVVGRIQTGSYTNRDGQKVYTTNVAVDDQEFCESKNSGSPAAQTAGAAPAAPAQGFQSPEGVGDGFLNIPDGLDEDLPFN